MKELDQVEMLLVDGWLCQWNLMKLEDAAEDVVVERMEGLEVRWEGLSRPASSSPR